ncbi:MAG: electron transport complex subunit RsxC [candidate division WOR-3 bacterium]
MFINGIKFTANKELLDKAIEVMPNPRFVYIPFSQHQGNPALPVVKPGDSVKIGTKIGEIDGNISACVHSSVAGKIIAIKKYPHPILGYGLACIIESSGVIEWDEKIKDVRKYENLTKEELINIIRDSGIVGLGGGMFPTHVKLLPPSDKRVELLIINGCESEVNLASDYRLMLEFPTGVVEGAKIFARILGVEKILFALQQNKKNAAALLKKEGAEVKVLNNYYPMGSERQLIKALTKKEVPQNGLPWDIGCVVQNVATCYAAFQAVKFNKPLVERVITITGDCIDEPKNLIVKIGTTVKDIIDYCGGAKGKIRKVVMGGLMTGIAQFTISVPIIKGTTGVAVFSKIQNQNNENCVRCAFCVDACPMGLLPCQIYKFIINEDVARSAEFGVLDCIECGSCAYVCPANIPLVHYFKFAKLKLKSSSRSEIYA